MKTALPFCFWEAIRGIAKPCSTFTICIGPGRRHLPAPYLSRVQTRMRQRQMGGYFDGMQYGGGNSRYLHEDTGQTYVPCGSREPAPAAAGDTCEEKVTAKR